MQRLHALRVFTGRSRDRGETVAAVSGARFLAADAREHAEVLRSVDQALAMLGGIDVLVNNAGILFQGSIEATPPHARRELLAVNLTVAFLFAKACFGPMRIVGGSMIHIASDTGIRGIPATAAYSVTKAPPSRKPSCEGSAPERRPVNLHRRSRLGSRLDRARKTEGAMRRAYGPAVRV